MDEFESSFPTKTIQDCLEQVQLGNLIKKAKFLRRLDQCWQSLLPPHLQHRSQVANFAEGVLSIAVENAQFATELRYTRLALQQQLQATPFGIELELQKIRIFVNPPNITPTPTYRHKPILSASSAKLINETAAGVTDIKLKKALLRLAKRCPAWGKTT